MHLFLARMAELASMESTISRVTALQATPETNAKLVMIMILLLDNVH